MAYSFSGLSSTEGKYGCWAKPYFHYVLKLQGESSFVLDFGKAAHAIIETMIGLKNFDIADILAETIGKSNDFPAEELETLKKCVKMPIVSSAVKQGGTTEEYFEGLIKEDDPFSPDIRGYIDFYYEDSDAIHLIDWKTNRAVYEPLETHQLALYAGQLKRKYKKPVVGSLGFLRFNQLNSHEFTDTDIRNAEDWAYEKAIQFDERTEKVKSGGDPFEFFPKQPGKVCEYCGYSAICLKATDMPVAITTEEEALQTADFIQMNKEVTREAENRLKQYITFSGPIQNSLLRVGMNKSEYLTFSLGARKAVVNKMLSDGLDIGSILKIGSDAQNDLLKKHNWIEQDFIGLGAQKRSKTTLSIDKIEDKAKDKIAKVG
ncbi:MAG: PD-(D/E)XK nuclease family protein [Candidatus Pacebacteria bacterium]|nr:PD-(D/E)XK nuclease family protein [Candidatus Paceibacterota bacterium]